MHIFAIITPHQHRFCVYKGKKLKSLITCENVVLFALLVPEKRRLP